MIYEPYPTEKIYSEKEKSELLKRRKNNALKKFLGHASKKKKYKMKESSEEEEDTMMWKYKGAKVNTEIIKKAKTQKQRKSTKVHSQPGVSSKC